MELLKQLAETGILGLLLAIAIFAIYTLYRENKNLQEKRVQDALETRNKMLEPLQAIKQTVDLILTLAQQGKK